MDYRESPIVRQQRQFVEASRRPKKAKTEWTEIITVLTVVFVVGLAVGLVLLATV